jgi:Fic family protein
MFLLNIDNIRIDREHLAKLEEKKNKLYRYLVNDKKSNNLKLFRTYLKSLTRLEYLMNFKSAQFEATNKIETEEYHKNLLKGFDYIVDEVCNNNVIKDQKSLLYLHYLIDPLSHANNPGQTRTSEVMVGNYSPPQPQRIFSLLDNMFFNAFEISNPVIKAIYLHHEIVRIHPFTDGNGRLARMVENWILMFELYPPIVISKVIEREKYIRALEKSFLELEKNIGEANEFTTAFFNLQLRRLNNSLDYLYTKLKLY